MPVWLVLFEKYNRIFPSPKCPDQLRPTQFPLQWVRNFIPEGKEAEA
jgi:hypothetical protein